MISPNPLMDPFFDRSPRANELTKAEYCRQQRQLIRQFSQSPSMQLTLLMSKIVPLYIFVGFLSVLGTLVFVLLSNGRWYFIPIALVIMAIGVGAPYHWWTKTQKLAKAVEHLAYVHGGSWGSKRLINILDWFDAHWPAEHPLEVVAYVSSIEHRWDWQLTFAKRPVLLVVHRPVFIGVSSSTQYPNIDRIIFFIAGSPESSQLNMDTGSALQELEKLGYFVKRTDAGVVVANSGVDVKKLDPTQVKKVLKLATQIA
jgi:hypothetical protein